LKIKGVIEELLCVAGFELTPVADAHLCCGSAGTYSLLQPELSQKLRNNKLVALNAGSPRQVATANIGCLCHLSRKPVGCQALDQMIDEVLGEPGFGI
jgi:glycolate oxidase iron-sulfur subunit